MVNIRVSIIALILLIAIVFIFTYHSLSCGIFTNPTTNNSLSVSNNSSEKVLLASNLTNETPIDVDPVLPPRESILPGINWSRYPLLQNPYLLNFEVSPPTTAVNHTFLYVTITVDITDTSNETEVLRQLSGADLELQKILGPDSGPNMYGTVNGVMYYTAIMPYETEVYARVFH